jgi:hypothetical protein
MSPIYVASYVTLLHRRCSRCVGIRRGARDLDVVDGSAQTRTRKKRGVVWAGYSVAGGELLKL